MRIVRRLVILSLLVSALVGLGIYLPPAVSKILGQTQLTPKTASEDLDSLAAWSQDSTAEVWDRLLFHPLDRAFTMPPKSLRRHGHKAQWMAPKGLPLHEYALGVEKACRKNGIRIIDGREIRTSHTGQVRAEFVLVQDGAAEKDTLFLTLKIGQQSVPGSARMAIVFMGLDSIDLSDAALLRQSPFAINLAMNPFNTNPALQALKSGGGQVHLLAEIPMEPIAYPYINPGKNAIYLHFNEEQIRDNLDKAMSHLKEARGIATRHGDRAIESRPLLTRLFRYLVKHHLPLLDLTGSPRSLARDVAGETGGLAHRGTIVKDSNQFETEFAKRAAHAVKSSESVLVLQYSRSGFQRLLALVQEREADLEDMGLAFVPFNHLNHLSRPVKSGDPSEGAVEKTQPKPPKN